MEGLVNWLYRKLDCPECRAEHRVPIGGVQNFPNNLTIISFLDLTARAAGLTPAPPPPQPVSHLDYLKPRLPPPQEINAITGVASYGATRTAETRTSSPPPTPLQTPCPLCATHHDELVHCTHCQRRICAACKGSHLDTMKGDVGRVLQQIRRGFIRLEDTVRAWEAKEEQLKTNVEAVRTEISDIFIKYRQDLEDRLNNINTEVDMFNTSESRRIVTQKEHIQNSLQQMTQFCDNAENQVANADAFALTDTELMNIKHQCGLNMNSLRAFGPENIDSKRIRFKAETRHLNAAIVVFGQIIETGTGSFHGDGNFHTDGTDGIGSHSAHLTSQGSPTDSGSSATESPRAGRPFTSRFLTAERERAAAAAASAEGSAEASTEASTEDLSTGGGVGRSNSFHFGGQGRRLGRATDAPDSAPDSATHSPVSDVASRRLMTLTGSTSGSARTTPPSGTPTSSAGGDGSVASSASSPGPRQANAVSTASSPGPRQGPDRSLSTPSGAPGASSSASTSTSAAGLDRSASTPSGVSVSSNASVDSRSGSAERDVPPSPRDVSPDDEESVASRIMRRLNAIGLGFEEVAHLSTGRSGRGQQPQAATESETLLTNYLEKGTSWLKFGRRGADSGCFTWPRGVAVTDEGDIVVADSSNHRVQVFDSSGQFQRQFGRYGQADGEFDCLAGVCINKTNGQIITADRYNHRIQIFTSQGGWIRSFGEEGYWDGQMSYPWGVACAPDGNIFVCDKENHRVQVFLPNGTFMYSFGRLGCDDGCFENPHYVAVSVDGSRVVVSDSGNHRIQLFTPTGQHEMTIGREGSLNAQFKYPRGVLFDREGYILVGDSGNNRVQVFRPDGSFYACFLSWGSMDGQVKGIEGLAMTEEGRVIVCDRENHRIQVL